MKHFYSVLVIKMNYAHILYCEQFQGALVYGSGIFRKSHGPPLTLFQVNTQTNLKKDARMVAHVRDDTLIYQIGLNHGNL